MGKIECKKTRITMQQSMQEKQQRARRESMQEKQQGTR